MIGVETGRGATCARRRPHLEQDQHRLLASVIAVVFGEALTQAPCLCAHDGVDLRIDVTPAENRLGDELLAQRLAIAFQLLLDDVPQKPRERLRLQERTAREDPRELITNGMRWWRYLAFDDGVPFAALKDSIRATVSGNASP